MRSVLGTQTLLPLLSAVTTMALSGACGPVERQESKPGPTAELPAEPLTPPAPALEPAPSPPPPPAQAVLDDTIRAARELAQRRLLKEGEPLQPDLPPAPTGPLPGADQNLPPEGLPGLFAPLAVKEGSEPLANFEAALAELDAGTRQTPVRLAFYGASGVAADKWTGYVRAYLQVRFGDGGPGIIAAAPPHRWSHHQEFQFESSRHWTKHNSFRLDELAPPGYFGVMGQAMSADGPGEWTQLVPRDLSPSAKQLAFYEIHYLEQAGGGSFTVTLDDKAITELSSAPTTMDPAPRLARHRVNLAPGRAHTLRLELVGDGEVWLLGVVAETGQPGIVLDTLGANGAKTENHGRWDEALWAAHLRERDPVLYVLAYGNNESVDIDVPISQYESDYRVVLERFRETLPQASCLMIGPGDYPIIDHGQLLPRPRLAEIREVQLELAPEYECAFLDTLAVFGGEGSKAAWVEAKLGKDDYLHLTRGGYLRFGMAVGDALMQGYDWRRAGVRAEHE